MVLTMCSMDPKGSAVSSLGICGYISVIAALKFTYLLIKGLMFFFLRITKELFKLAMCLYCMTIRICSFKTYSTHEVNDSHFN